MKTAPRKTPLVAVATLAVLATLADSAAGAPARGKRPSIFADDRLCELLEWPCDDGGALPDRAAFVHEDMVASKCMKSCLPPELEHLHHEYDREHPHEDPDEVVMAGDETHGSNGASLEGPKPVDAMAMDALWQCEVRCKALDEIPHEQVPGLFGQNSHGRYLVLWESRVFAHPDHSRQARVELARVAADLRKQKHSQLSPIIYAYSGWHPHDEQVLAWWQGQHEAKSRQRPWQSVPESFGGWGRATMTLVENGEIVWDVFDVVHSSKHWRLLHDFDFGNEDVLRELDPFGVAGDLANALHYVLERFDRDHERLPLQVCLQIARIVLGPKFKQDLVYGKDEDHLDALTEFCEDLREEDEEDLVAHRGDIDYERYALMVKQMGVVDASGTLWKHALTTWRSVLSFVRQDHDKAQRRRREGSSSGERPAIALMASIVPVYEAGIEGDLGVGDRQEALMLSLCFRNSSIPAGATEERFATHGNELQGRINTDVFLAVIPCGDLSTREVLRCIKGALADARAASLDLAKKSQGAFYELAGLIFGVGFVGKPEYAALRTFWSADPGIPTEGDFPADHVTEKYASEHQRRHRKPSKVVYKDEL